MLRTTAEQALSSDDEATVQWAVEQLLSTAHDAEIDGPHAERARSFLADARLRRAIFAQTEIVHDALAVLRADLRAGALSYREAVRVVEAIGDVYGGVAPHGTIACFTLDRPSIRDNEQAYLQAKLGLCLGPPELRGPPTEAEWEALRQARRSATFASDHEHLNLWVKALSSGPWTEGERAELLAFVAAFRQGDDNMIFHLATTLAAKPDIDLFPLYDELLPRCWEASRPTLREIQAAVRRSLGLSNRAPAH